MGASDPVLSYEVLDRSTSTKLALNIWLDGWDLNLSIAQARANTPEAKLKWRAGGGVVPMHVVQAAEDIVSPPEVGSALLAKDFPHRVSVSVVERAAHALLPEQPEAVAAAVLGFLQRRTRAS